MKKNNVKLNYIYNLAYQIFALITPLITTPYISRVLGSEGVGQYSFTYSIVTYFTLLGALGFGVYAQREIARNQGNQYEQTKIFWEINIARLASVGTSLIIYLILIFSGIYNSTYTTLMWILMINVISTAVDEAFFFQGNENFGFIALRNILIKCIGIALIFIFVKDESDVWIYALCQSIILILSNIALWTRLPKMLVKIKARELNVKRHFIPTLRLFVPTVAISVYTMLDKTLIGVLVPGTNESGQAFSDLENGYYEQAEKIVKMAMTVVTALGTVMIPRNSQAIASGNIDEFKKNINGAMQFVFFIGVPIMFGVAGISFNFSPWFFGNGYEKVPYLMIMLCPLIMIIGLSNVLGLQYLLPLKKDTKYTIAIISGAGINLILNLILIHFFWSVGACIATVAAELTVTVIMFIFSRKDVSFFKIILSSWKYIVSGIIMFAAVFFTQYFLPSSIPYTLLLILEGIVVYFGFLLIFKDELIFRYIKKVKNRLSKNKLKQ